MIELLIDRKWPKQNYAIGVFYIDGGGLCNSLEDADRGLMQSMPTGVIMQKKIPGKTAIPKGMYRVILSVSPKFKGRAWAKKWGGKTPEILNVKGYSGVRIHPANKAEEIEGCIAIGDNTKVGQVTNSVRRYDELMSIIVPRMENGEECYITIK